MATKIIIVLYERTFKFFYKCLLQIFHILLQIVEIFSLKAMNCPPSWIIEDMHETSQGESRKVFILTASDKDEPTTRFWLLSQIPN